ncbi:MAG: RNA polymerase sigma factor [Cyclobacteriaceae bacterium]|jgi:RNA polymerase sigma-70 factor, ECF subfamily|nr:RNA polymerase sigma factor [Cyclobacteriaceae bacterium]
MFFKKRLAHISDEELMRKVQQGNESALTEIYQRYSIALLRYFTRMLWQDGELAEDFLQDLFLKVIDNPGRFDSTRNFSTWIYSSAHNMCKNEYRNRANRGAMVIPMESQNNTDPHKLIDERDFKERLDLLLETLDDESKTLFLLRYEQELDLQKISDILAIPVGTIKSRLFYLRKGLSQELSEYKIILKEGML